MKIDYKIIKALDPCEDRFDNYMKHYKKFNGNLEDFIFLDKITYSDKVWVVTRLFTKEQNVAWSLKCAESCLSNFESVYPDDKRPRKALEAVQKYLNNPCVKTQSAARLAAKSARSAAESAADSAAESAVILAESATRSATRSAVRLTAESARSAACSAWSAARSAAKSIDSARLTWLAVMSATDSTTDSTTKTFQEELNLLFMIEVLK